MRLPRDECKSVIKFESRLLLVDVASGPGAGGPRWLPQGRNGGWGCSGPAAPLGRAAALEQPGEPGPAAQLWSPQFIGAEVGPSVVFPAPGCLPLSVPLRRLRCRRCGTWRAPGSRGWHLWAGTETAPVRRRSRC